MNITLNEKTRKVLEAMEHSKIVPLSKFAGAVSFFSPVRKFSSAKSGVVYVGTTTEVNTQKAITVDTFTKSGRPTVKDEIVTEKTTVKPSIKIKTEDGKTQINYWLLKNMVTVYDVVLEFKDDGTCYLKSKINDKKSEYSFKYNGKKIVQVKELKNDEKTLG